MITLQADISKSKVEKIVNQVEEAQVTKAEVKEDVKPVHSEDKKTIKKENVKETTKANEEFYPVDVEPASGALPEGHHQIQGVITDMPSSMPVTKEGKDVMKYIFKMNLVREPLRLKFADLGDGLKMAQDYGREIASKALASA